MPEPKVLLGMILSEAVFRLTGFGPSRGLCDEFAERVLAQAETVGHPITLPATFPITGGTNG
jgi:hypothetical protein